MTQDKIKANIKALKEKRGMTWREISERTGIKSANLRIYMADDKRRIPVSWLYPLSYALGVGVEELLIS